VRLRSWIAVAALSVVAPATLHYYGAWRRGDDIYIPRVGTVYRFPCSGYQLQTRDYTTTQAFAVIDGAARAARSNAKGRVTDLVDAVFDRVLESVRCGNPLRRRVADAEWRFRRGTVAPIPEYALAEAASFSNGGSSRVAEVYRHGRE